MCNPVLIDTDPGIDDAMALALAVAAGQIDLVGVVSVGGNVPVAQAAVNVERLLKLLNVHPRPLVGRGLDQQDRNLVDARNVHGEDGLGNLIPPATDAGTERGYLEVYEQLISRHGSELTILAIGPLTNLAAVDQHRPGLLSRAGQIVIMGGALWCPGNVNTHAEFNFYRDPRAAAAVLSAGLPVTLVPLDVTRQVPMDESHAAHLARGPRPGSELLAEIVRFSLDKANTDTGRGTFLVHDALTVGVLLWPELFLRSRMVLEVLQTGEAAGKSRPMMSKDKVRQTAVVISVKAVDFLERMLETLCREPFVV